jgi:hypothetical protein
MVLRRRVVRVDIDYRTNSSKIRRDQAACGPTMRALAYLPRKLFARQQGRPEEDLISRI